MARGNKEAVSALLPPPDRRFLDDLVMADGGIEADEGLHCFRFDDGAVHMLAGEGADGVEGGPAGEHQELDLVGPVMAQE